ncbi:nucleoside triphosphate pyrophosphohydrolase [candidate division WOR-3 bacterium]|nr:nucleoside triphosphate pyrophosphohydrolase [candidate division WOR-3 bacterium]
MEKEKDIFWDFVETVSVLRKKCPWDRVQTIESLSEHLLEEAAEAKESVFLTSEKLREELGDLLLVIVMMSAVAHEKGFFDIEDVLKGIREKIVFRHPHIFAEERADTPEDVWRIWKEMKLKEIRKSDSLLKIASAVQKEASETGFDWDCPEKVIEKLNEEISELAQSGSFSEREEETGDILFVVVHLANHLGVDPEIALGKTIEKFKKRFAHVKKKMTESGLDMNVENIDTMEYFWRQKAEKD